MVHYLLTFHFSDASCSCTEGFSPFVSQTVHISCFHAYSAIIAGLRDLKCPQEHLRIELSIIKGGNDNSFILGWGKIKSTVFDLVDPK